MCKLARQGYVHDAMDIWVKYSQPVMSFFEKLWWYGRGVEVVGVGGHVVPKRRSRREEGKRVGKNARAETEPQLCLKPAP